MTFKKILVPYDGLSISDKAMEKAVEISNLIERSQITVIHVIEKSPHQYLIELIDLHNQVK